MRSPGTDTSKRTMISDNVSIKLDPKLVKIENRMETLEDLMKQMLSHQTNFLQMMDISWVADPRQRMSGIINGAAIHTVSGIAWVEN